MSLSLERLGIRCRIQGFVTGVAVGNADTGPQNITFPDTFINTQHWRRYTTL